MTETQEKSRQGVRAPEAAEEANMQLVILEKTREVFKPSAKQFETLRAEFAILGVSLSRSYRADDRSVSYVVRSHLGARYFSHWHDVLAYRASLQWVVCK